MNCQEAQNLIEDVIDRRPSGGTRRKLDLHLARCAECRALFAAEQREHARWFRAFNDPALPHETLPPAFADRLAAAVAVRKPRRPFLLRLPRWGRVAALFAAMAAFAAFGMWTAAYAVSREAAVDRAEPRPFEAPKVDTVPKIDDDGERDAASSLAAIAESSDCAVTASSTSRGISLSEGMDMNNSTVDSTVNANRGIKAGVCGLSLLGAVGILVPAQASTPLEGGVFKDALYWYTGAVDRNGDGYLSQTPGDEMRNTLCANDTSNPSNKAYAAAGPLKAFEIDRLTVKCPYAGLTIDNASVLRSRPGAYDPRAEGWVFVANASKTLNQNTSYTVLMRARRESGSPYYSVFATVGNVRFGVMGSEGPWVAFPGEDKCIGGWTGGEEWFDLAFVMNAEEQKAHVYAIYEGQSFRTAEIPYTQGYKDWTGGSAAAYLFYPNWTGPNGAFHQFAVWERALSEAEVREAFSWPACAQGYKMQVGYRNDSADEFATMSDLTDISAANPLSAYPHALNSSHSEITMSLRMDADHPIDASEHKEGLGAKYSARSQAVICRLTPDSGAGELEAYANGTLIASEPVSARSVFGFVVPDSVATDVTTLKLKWKSGGDIKVDTVIAARDGDWQIGYRNNSCFDDGFTPNYVPEYRVGTAWNGFTRCLTGAGNGNWTNIALKVSLPEEFTRFEYRMEVRWVHMVGGENPRNGIRVNGKVKALDTVAGSWTTTTAVIRPVDLVTGENTFDLFRGTDIGSISGDYDQIDYVKFEPVRYAPERGTLLIFR